jgi:hypothetical protein
VIETNYWAHIIELFALLVSYAAYIGSYVANFQDNLSIQSSTVMHDCNNQSMSPKKCIKFLDYLYKYYLH